MTTFKVDARTFSSVRDLNGIPLRTMQHLYDTYKTWVDKANEVLQRMPNPDIHSANPVFSDYRSLKTALPELLGEVRNYDSFLSALGGKGTQPIGPVQDMIRRDFGGWDAFVNELKATGLVSRGWVAVVYDTFAERLFIHACDGPGSPPAWGAIPLLTLNVSEHAIALDFGRNRMRWVDACLANVDWERITQTLESTLKARGENLYS
jgi:superoxide dismutase, Fe-Mn family